MKFQIALLSLLLFFTATILATPPVTNDPLVGRWIWYKSMIVTFNADGTASSPDLKGTWIFNNNSEVQRKYRVVWNEGVFINKVTMSEDQKTLLVQDPKSNGKWTAERAVSAH